MIYKLFTSDVRRYCLKNIYHSIRMLSVDSITTLYLNLLYSLSLDLSTTLYLNLLSSLPLNLSILSLYNIAEWSSSINSIKEDRDNEDKRLKMNSINEDNERQDIEVNSMVERQWRLNDWETMKTMNLCNIHKFIVSQSSLCLL